eukprot:CAMPEP_0113695554 /NCGR_PEP_ID=MMETSP0038_2-20120614/20972_1 /TAXON_ID=2898 /ORGANISM="Cryptomonas paramecium" /LENGTH=589 /DNA_ID=CAMNT_0000618125 /DNA_START=36 /DNA_END=1802 /DNA_ORIENTATION=- /assembly_acc=CAM_ASM_000170
MDSIVLAPSPEYLVTATASSLVVWLYMIIITNSYPKEILRSSYEADCGYSSYFAGSAFLFQNISRLEEYQRGYLNYNSEEVPSLVCMQNPWSSSESFDFSTQVSSVNVGNTATPNASVIVGNTATPNSTQNAACQCTRKILERCTVAQNLSTEPSAHFWDGDVNLTTSTFSTPWLLGNSTAPSQNSSENDPFTTEDSPAQNISYSNSTSSYSTSIASYSNSTSASLLFRSASSSNISSPAVSVTPNTTTAVSSLNFTKHINGGSNSGYFNGSSSTEYINGSGSTATFNGSNTEYINGNSAINGSNTEYINGSSVINGSSDGWTGMNGSEGTIPTTRPARPHPHHLMPCPCRCLDDSASTPSNTDAAPSPPAPVLPPESNVAFVWQYTLNWTHYYTCISAIPTELLPTLSTAIDRNKGIAGWVLSGPSGLLCLFAVGLGHKLRDRLLQAMALVTYLAFHGVLAGNELVWMGHVGVAGVTLAGLAACHARIQTVAALRSRLSMFLIVAMIALELSFLGVTVAAAYKVLPSSRSDWYGSILEQTIVSIFNVLNLIAIWKLAKSAARARSSHPEELVLESLDEEEPAKPPPWP